MNKATLLSVNKVKIKRFESKENKKTKYFQEECRK